MEQNQYPIRIGSITAERVYDVESYETQKIMLYVKAAKWCILRNGNQNNS